MFKNLDKCRSTLLAGCATIFLLADTAAQAQELPNNPQSTGQSAQMSDTAPDIIVTAQRKEEKLSRVPVSVIALDAETLKTRVVTSEQDLGALVPGLLVKTGQNNNQLSFSMRGQTLDPFSGSSPSVLTYLNEAPFTGGNTATAFFDMSSVQVLKGPQGALFGRNATGGAILYSTPVPGNEVGGYLTVRGGDRSMFQVQGAIDIPLVRDKLALRLAGDFIRADGYMTNINTGSGLGDKNNKSGRVTVLFTPTDTIKNVLLFQYSHIGGTEGTGELYNYYTVGQTNNGFPLTSTLDAVYGPNSPFAPGVGSGPAAPGRWPGGPAGYLAFQQKNPYKVWLQYDLPHKAHAAFLSNTTTVDLSTGLTLKNIFSYTDTFARTPGNLAGSPFGALWLFNFPGVGIGKGPPGGETFDVRGWSEELQAQGKLPGSNLSYIAGFFASTTRNQDYVPVNVGPDLPTSLADISQYYRKRDKSRAVYGQLTYEITDKLTAAAGGRYTWEDVSILQLAGSVYGGLVPEQRRSLQAPSWTLNVQYQITPQDMVYFAQRGSFRAGNFNGTVTPVQEFNFFGNEKTHDFEIGFKHSGRLGNIPLRFNLALYQQIVKNAQHAIYAIVAGNPAGFTVNVPEEKIKGIETDAAVQLASWLDVGMTLAYTDAKYTKNLVDLSRQTGIPGSIIPFDSYPDTPRWSGSAFVNLKLPTPQQWGRMYLRADGFGQTHTYFSSNEGSITPGTRLKGYTTTDFRYSWDAILGSQFSAGLYLKNAFDRLYYTSGFPMGGAGGYNTANPAQPRTFGAELSVKF
jgi:iron complex outermembrane receptor protein